VWRLARPWKQGVWTAVFGGLLTSSRLTTHPLLSTRRTAHARHRAPIGRLSDGHTSSFDAVSPSISLSIFLDLEVEPPPVLWWSTTTWKGHLPGHTILKMCLKSALVLRSLHPNSSSPTIHSLISSPLTSLHLTSSSVSRALVPSRLLSSFHPPWSGWQLSWCLYHLLASSKLLTNYAPASTRWSLPTP